jgi:hypothetical protein
MLTPSIVLLHDNVRQHTATRTQALLEYFNLELSDNRPYSPDVSVSDCRQFTYLENWMGSQCFSNNEMLMECVKT